jgi:glucose-6-phosphate isomerase
MDLLTRWPALDVDTRRAQLRGTLSCSTAPVQNAWEAQAADASRAAAGLWHRDPAVWSADAGVGRKIADRLGWLGSPALMADAIPRLRQFAEAIRRDRFEDVVLLGMGGSSLAPEVLRSVIGVASGWPRFHMLDSTDPAAVRAVDTHPPRTLYILASKSGGTIEPNSLAAHFAGALRSSGVERWGQHFVAITDPHTALAERARDENFRETFLNPPDIGGRYSALSYFGLVPAALMGQDLEALVGWALAMLAAAQEEPDPQKNPAVALGLLMAAGANSRKDKLTLLLPSRLEPFGLWVEQLVAESTGKEGTGVVPIAGEPVPGRAADYSGDRVFVYSRLRGASGSTDVPAGHSDAALSSAGFPLAAIEW